MEKKFGKLSVYNLWLFTEVVRHGMMHVAARETGVHVNVLSYEIKVLEESLQEKIFIRDRKKLYLTDVGKTLSDFAHETLSRFWETGLSEIPKIAENKKTKIILGTSHGIAETHLINLIEILRDELPNVNLRILAGREYMDFLETGCDIVIGPKIENRAYLSQTMLREFSYYWFANKVYIKKYGKPSSIDDLKNHTLLIFNRDYSNYSENLPEESIFVESDSFRSLVKLAKNGIGILPMPRDYTTTFLEENKDFIDLFPETPCEVERFFFSHPKITPKLEITRKIRDICIKLFRKEGHVYEVGSCETKKLQSVKSAVF